LQSDFLWYTSARLRVVLRSSAWSESVNHARTVRDVPPTPSDDYGLIEDPIENQGRDPPTFSNRYISFLHFSPTQDGVQVISVERIGGTDIYEMVVQCQS